MAEFPDSICLCNITPSERDVQEAALSRLYFSEYKQEGLFILCSISKQLAAGLSVLVAAKEGIVGE